MAMARRAGGAAQVLDDVGWGNIRAILAEQSLGRAS